MIYVALGMHKSGTTLVSQILHKSDIRMGEHFDEDVSYEAGNQWERREAFLINLDLVGCHEKDYFSLDHFRILEPRMPDDIRGRMLEMVAHCDRQGGDWGFKEPLTCLTYRLWSQALPPHKLIAIYRSPLDVMNHYRARRYDIPRAWRVLRAWTNYNLGVLTALQARADDGILLRYEDLMQGDQEFRRLEEFVGRPLTDRRRPSGPRRPARYPLFHPLDRCLGMATGVRPSRVLCELDALRQAQIDRSTASR